MNFKLIFVLIAIALIGVVFAQKNNGRVSSSESGENSNSTQLQSGTNHHNRHHNRRGGNQTLSGSQKLTNQRQRGGSRNRGNGNTLRMWNQAKITIEKKEKCRKTKKICSMTSMQNDSIKNDKWQSMKKLLNFILKLQINLQNWTY